MKSHDSNGIVIVLVVVVVAEGCIMDIQLKDM